MSLAIVNVLIERERDLVFARQRTRHVAQLLGFESQDQTRIATAVSEIARNAFRYAGGGRVEFALEGKTPPQVLLITIRDTGPGIANLQAVLDGQYRSATGMGLGIIGAKRLMDGFEIGTGASGTEVQLKKLLPRGAGVIKAPDVARIADELAKAPPQDAYEEIQRQNQELLSTLEELRRRQDELLRLNRELEDTNRGVVALYAELDEKADHLRRADELKTRFLSNMSHEFRTPLNSILALSELLLGRADGDLTPEQEKQVSFVRKAAEGLSELVNDLLDLAKVEAGKTVVRPVEFTVPDLFGALRGMLRPLLTTSSVNLVFEDPEGLPVMHTDEAKVSQILRNFISNGLKFTEQGEVRVRAEADDRNELITFSVHDTGIGIAPDDQERIFQDFTQVDSPLQRKARGTGLGLPLTRKLADLLGGSVSVSSELGRGSVFSVTLPVRLQEERVEQPPTLREGSETGIPILIVEDTPEDVLIYEKFLKGTGYRPVSVPTLFQAREILTQMNPRAIILDVLLRGCDSWEFLAQLKAVSDFNAPPVLVVTTVDDEAKARSLGADAFSLKPVSRKWLLSELHRLVGPGDPTDEEIVASLEPGLRPVLIVEDNYDTVEIYRAYLKESGFQPVPARTVAEAKRLLPLISPVAVVLDVLLPGENAWDLLAHVKSHYHDAIPVFVVSVLDDQRRGFALGADEYCVKPVSRDWLLRKLHSFADGRRLSRILMIDDEEASRYVVRTILSRSPQYEFVEASSGAEGLQIAAREHPDAILLDLIMPGLDGFEVLNQLKRDPRTSEIPVIINTASNLSDAERERLNKSAEAIVSKNACSIEDLGSRIRDALREAGIEKEAH